MKARVAVLLVLLCGLALSAVPMLGVGPASAHDALRGTDPAAGASIATAPSAVRLTFTEPILEGTAKVQVTGPAGIASTGQIAVKGTTLAAALTASLPDGGYTVLWRVTSADGHPVSGKFTFTLKAAGPATPNQQTLPTPDPDATPVPVASSPLPATSATASSSAAGGLDTTPVQPTTTPAPSTTPIIVAVLLTGLVAGFAWWLRGRRVRRGTPAP